MFRIAYKNWFDTGGVYGRWRAIPVPPEQIAAEIIGRSGLMQNSANADFPASN